MVTFTDDQHQAALVKRRIKFVVEKGAMARLFKAGTNGDLQDELFRIMQPRALGELKTVNEFDDWLLRTIELPCWAKYSRNGLKNDRWAYFAKLINIVIYEIAANRELFSDVNWERLRGFLHVPIDENVMMYLEGLDPGFPRVLWLKGMTKDKYLAIQSAARALAQANGVPPIWFEAAWTA